MNINKQKCFLEFIYLQISISFLHLQGNLYIHFSYIQTPPNHQLQGDIASENNGRVKKTTKHIHQIKFQQIHERLETI